MTATAALAPTPERIRHQRSSYQKPEQGQKTSRPYGRFAPWFETMARKATVDGPMQLAASDIDFIWRVANSVPGLISSYGDQRWSTPVEHMSPEELLRPERRAEAYRKLQSAKDAVNDTAQWSAIECMIRRDDGDMTEAGHWVGYQSVHSARRHGARLVKAALVKLSWHFGYVKKYHHPPR